MGLASNIGQTITKMAGETARGASSVGKLLANAPIESASSFWGKHGARVAGGATIGAVGGGVAGGVSGGSVLGGAAKGAAAGGLAGGAVGLGGGLRNMQTEYLSHARRSKLGKDSMEAGINFHRKAMGR